jgi:AcrR family transcriptional regulator
MLDFRTIDRTKERAVADGTAERILDAARQSLLALGYAKLSTREIADAAGVPLSQLHYHFGSKRQLILALLDRENARLLERQTTMFGAEAPLWKQWEQACDFLEDDLASGYVRVLQEMIAAGWSDPEIAAAVRRDLQGWHTLLSGVAERALEQLGGLGPFTPAEAAALAGNAFLGAEALILLGFDEEQVPSRAALRRIAELIRAAKTR